MESVIDAIAAKQRAGERRTFDDAAKATLRCIMRCYGYERFDNPSAQLSWLQTYADVKTQRDFMNVAWNLLEHILVFPGRRGEYWEMHHRPDRVKATRCGVDGLRSDVLKLQKEIRAWQEEFDQRSMPTIDQHAALRSRIDDYVGSEPARRVKRLTEAYPAAILAMQPVGDWPGRDEDVVDEEIWRSGFERDSFFRFQDGRKVWSG